MIEVQGLWCYKAIKCSGGTGIFQRHNFEGLWSLSDGEELSGGHPHYEHRTPNGQVVHLFHEVASAIPTGIRLSELNQKEEQLVLRGVTQSNARVSEFMRMLDASEWMTTPSVRYIEAERDAKQSKFELILKRTAPGKEGEMGAGDYVEESFNG